LPVPSLDWALYKLAGVWATDGNPIKCPLPGHDDVLPSFNLWAPDDDNFPQRYGCFGCGRGGTVLDLIAEFTGLEGDALAHKAAELSDEESRDETPRISQRQKAEPKDLDKLLSDAHESLNSSRMDEFQKYLREKRLDGEELETYLMDEWEWVPAEGNVVYCAHRDGSGKLTGIKKRKAEGKKGSVTGSEYLSLYGSWRDQGRKSVVLCEGESDTVWAAWSLRELDYDVLGLPSGVNQAIRTEWLERLADRDVTIVFDSDGPGMKGAQIWIEKIPSAKLARVPEDEDLLSCGIPVRELIERARRPKSSLRLITVAEGIFAKATAQGSVPVADFSFVPVREIWTDDGPAWDINLSEGGSSVIRSQDFHSGQSLTRWANRHGNAWVGSGQTPQALLNWMKSESAFLPLERATSKAGRIGRSFVGPELCVGPDRLRYLAPALGNAHLETRISVQRGEFDPFAILALERLNDPGMMAVILGWLCATLLRGQRAPAPPLFVGGESGAGKTTMLSTLLETLGLKIEANLTTTTPFGVDSLVNSCIGFPVWFDEFRGGAREDSMSRLRQLLRDAYFGQPSMKGGMSQQMTELTEVTTWAGIIVSGEMSSTETSHRDRMIMLDLEKDSQNKQALEYLRVTETTGLGYALLEYLASRPDSLFRVRPQGPADLPDRIRDALGFMQTGWDAWKHFRWEQGITEAPAEPSIEKLASERRQVQDPWMQAIHECAGVLTRDGTAIVEQTEAGVILLAGEVVVEARRLQIELPARANELVSWLRNRYEVEDIRLAGGRRAKLVRGMQL
jgi:5S rRNA maturation endonuclease (ribonuclease M5)